MFDPLFIAAGDLRHSVRIEAPSATQDAFGQPSSTWTTVLTTRASIQTLTPRETNENGNLVSQVVHQIKIRYPGRDIRIVSGQRVVGDTQTYRIQAVDDVQNRHRVLRLLCVVIDEASS